jgi:hypothetical protein
MNDSASLTMTRLLKDATVIRRFQILLLSLLLLII